MFVEKDLVTGDTHGHIDINKFGFRNFPEGRELTKQNHMFIMGDFGVVWDGGKQDQWWLDWLQQRPWTTCFVDGNHENFPLLHEYPEVEYCGGKANKLNDSVYWLRRGEVFNINGNKILAFGGDMSHDKGRIEGKSWWPEEQATQADFDNAIKNLDKHDWTVDYVFSHTVPFHEKYTFMPGMYGMDGFSADRTEHILDEIKQRLRFKHWYFGHLHLNQTAGRYTCLYEKIIELGTNIWGRDCIAD